MAIAIKSFGYSVQVMGIKKKHGPWIKCSKNSLESYKNIRIQGDYCIVVIIVVTIYKLESYLRH